MPGPPAGEGPPTIKILIEELWVKPAERRHAGYGEELAEP